MHSGVSADRLWEVFSGRSTLLGDRAAISSPQGHLTFTELFAVAGQLADRLAEAGVTAGQTVGLCMPNSLAFVPAFLALNRLSVAIALISTKYRESELLGIDAAVAPAGFVTTAATTGFIRGTLPLGASRLLPVTGLEEEFCFSPSAVAAADRPSAGLGESRLQGAAVIKFTSGSTGTPKGIALTAENLLAEARNVVETLGLSPADRILAPVPLFHSYGFDLGVLAMLQSGAHLVMRDSFVPRRILTDLADPGVSVFLGVPSMYHIFCESFLPEPPDLHHLRYLLSCTAPLSPELIAAFQQKFGMPICQHYGSSETGAATNHLPAAVAARPESVGRAMQNVELIIIDDAGQPLPPGEVGEVVIRSQVVARGYLMGAPPGPSRFGDHSYRTGDLGFLDEEGFLFLRGRKDDVINVGGFKVSPQEVSRVLERHPAVREAAVIGVRDAMGEEIVYAVVTLKAPADEQELLAHCRPHLADYKVPRRVEIREEMPRGPSGKIRLTPEDIRL